MKYAFINEGVLQDVVMTHPSILFSEGYAKQFVEVPDDCFNGWRFDGISFLPPPEKTTEDVANTIRFMRNERLAECDWTQIPDSSADKAAWANYRQLLRDVPTQEGFPWSVTWPVPPST